MKGKTISSNKMLHKVFASFLAFAMVITTIVPAMTTESYAKKFKGEAGYSYNVWVKKSVSIPPGRSHSIR